MFIMMTATNIAPLLHGLKFGHPDPKDTDATKLEGKLQTWVRKQNPEHTRHLHLASPKIPIFTSLG